MNNKFIKKVKNILLVSLFLISIGQLVGCSFEELDNEIIIDSLSDTSQDDISNKDPQAGKETQVDKDPQANTDDKEDYVIQEKGFRNSKYLNQHFEKHGKDMGFSSEKEYEEAAIAVVNNKNALHKIEADDGDGVYYIEETNEFVIVSVDGYIRTYFNPSDGIRYYNRQ